MTPLDHGELVLPEAPPGELELGRDRDLLLGGRDRRRRGCRGLDDRAHPCSPARMRGSIHISTRSERKVPITVSTPSSSTIAPARNMSWATSERSSKRPDRRQRQHQRDDDAARDDERQQVADRAGERVERGAHRILHDHAPFRQAAGARGRDVGPAQLVEQVGAHDADQLRGAGERQDQRRQRQVQREVPDLAPGPGRQLVRRREQPADVGVEIAEREIEDDQREQEIGHGEADEADEGEDVVGERVLPHRRVDADRQARSPRSG